VNRFLWQTFSFVCGQNPDHTWAPGHTPLPFCQRCAGLYAGAGLCVALLLILRPRLTGRFIAAHGLLLLIVAPFGLHWIPHGPALRTITGVFCGFGIGMFLWLVPATAWNWADVTGRRTATRAYAAGLGAASVLVPLAGGYGSAIAYWGLELLAAAGALSLAALVLTNLALGLRGISRWLTLRPRP
jgi:uncharacterized membrane protein